MANNNNCSLSIFLLFIILFSEALLPIVCSPILGIYWLFTYAEPSVRNAVLISITLLVIGIIIRRKRKKQIHN